MFLKLRFLALALCVLPLFSTAKDGTTPSSLSATDKLSFIENKGQITDQFNNPRSDVQFKVSTPEMNVFIGNGQIHYQFNKVNGNDRITIPSPLDALQSNTKKTPPTVTSYRMDVQLVGANIQAPVVTELEQEYVERYYRATAAQRNGAMNVTQSIEAHSFKRITYKNVYPNIDWVLSAVGNSLKYDFVVRPGGNPNDIKLKYGGATSLKIMEEGNFQATTPMGIINEARPFSYKNGGKEVASAYKLNGDVLSFDIANYQGTLVIDPTLTWGTYLGGSNVDIFYAVATDATNNVYASGTTLSTSNIATINAFQTTLGGQYDFILSKFSSSGSLLFSTYLGGVENEIGACMTISGTNVFVGGNTDAFVDDDALIAKFTTAGVYTTGAIFGDVGNENCTGIGADASGNVYFTGTTNSNLGITTSGASQPFYGGGVFDGYVVKVSGALGTGSLLWATYYGGSMWDIATGLKVDASSNVFVCGTTQSTNNIATNATSLNGTYDAYIVKFNSSGVRQFGTYTGGNALDEGRTIELDATGNIYLAGYTQSTSGLATTGANQTTIATGGFYGLDTWLGKYSSTGTKLWATYYGGNGDDYVFAIINLGGNIVIGGYTDGTTGIASATNSYQPTYGGGSLDGYMAKFNSTGSLLWGTYYGGSGEDDLIALAASGTTDFYAAGVSLSSNAIVTTNASQTINNGAGDAFLSKFSDCILLAAPTTLTGPTSLCEGATQTYTVSAVTGATSYTYTLPSGLTGTSTTNTITVTATLGSTGGVLSVSANNTCGTGAPLNTTITVTPVPVATITATGPTTFCQGGNVLLTTVTTSGYSYQWRLNNINLPGATNSTYSATASGNYKVIVSNGTACADTTAIATVVTATPPPATPAVTNNAPVCIGQTINLTASSTTPGVTYIWTGPNGYVSTNQNPVITNATANDAGVYTVTVDQGGCTATSTTTVVVSGGAPSQPGTISGNNTVCTGNTEIFMVPNDPNASSYTWTLPAGWSGASTTNSITVTAGTANGSISVIANSGCGNSAAQTLTVMASQPPAVTITQSGATLLVTASFATYQWYVNGTAIPGATMQSFTTTQSGDYYVVISSGICDAQSNIITVTTGIQELGTAHNFSLFPNPNDGNFTLKGAFSNANETIDLMIADVTGRIVYRQNLTLRSTSIEQNISVEHLPAGVYMLRIGTDAGSEVLPFVKK